MASRGDGVVFLCHRFCRFVLVIPSLGKNERHAWLRISLSSVPSSSTGVGAGCAIAVLFVRRPNQDDIVYFHRALSQLSALNKPVYLHQTSVDMKAAAFSPVHLATSHEMLMALLDTILGSTLSTFIQ
jgi:hypothetical protein